LHEHASPECLREEKPEQLLPGQFRVRTDVPEEGAQRPGAQGVVVRDRHVVLASPLGGEPDVASRLPVDHVAQSRQGPGQVTSGDVPGEPQAEITSSRTRWSRMALGRDASSGKWQ
jgi:hypothetical protein